jgi:hypothetical protein
MAESNPTVEPNERWIEMCACDGPKEIRYSSASIMSEQKKVPKGISVGIHGPPPITALRYVHMDGRQRGRKAMCAGSSAPDDARTLSAATAY